MEDNKPIILVSATRLSPIKGKNRMKKLAKALDEAKINYVWYIFTNDTNAIESPNVIYMKPRLDVSKWICQADYLVQLSDTEACSYAINEALYRNIPVIVTPLPYLEEIGIQDGVNSYVLDFDCSNLNNIIKKITKVPKFKFKQLNDNYTELFVKSKSHFEEQKKAMYTVEATNKYTSSGTWDVELSRLKQLKQYIPKQGERWEVNYKRKELLVEKGYVKVVGKS